MGVLRDRFGRLLSRLRGQTAAARNPYASVVQRKLEEAKLNRDRVQRRNDSYLDRLKADRERQEKIRKVVREGQEAIRDDQKQILAPDSLEPALGIARDVGPENQETPWVPVASSNVAAIRWVGGNWGLQVRFLKSGWEYEYYVPYSTYLQMLNAPSKGRFVWFMRMARIPYHRLTIGISPTRLAYEWGRTVGGQNNRELLRNPNAPSYESRRQNLSGLRNGNV